MAKMLTWNRDTVPGIHFHLTVGYSMEGLEAIKDYGDPYEKMFEEDSNHVPGSFNPWAKGPPADASCPDNGQ